MPTVQCLTQQELEHTSATLAAMDASNDRLAEGREELRGQRGLFASSRRLLRALFTSSALDTVSLYGGLAIFFLVVAYILQVSVVLQGPLRHRESSEVPPCLGTAPMHVVLAMSAIRVCLQAIRICLSLFDICLCAGPLQKRTLYFAPVGKYMAPLAGTAWNASRAAAARAAQLPGTVAALHRRLRPRPNGTASAGAAADQQQPEQRWPYELEPEGGSGAGADADAAQQWAQAEPDLLADIEPAPEEGQRMPGNVLPDDLQPDAEAPTPDAEESQPDPKNISAEQPDAAAGQPGEPPKAAKEASLPKPAAETGEGLAKAKLPADADSAGGPNASEAEDSAAHSSLSDIDLAASLSGGGDLEPAGEPAIADSKPQLKATAQARTADISKKTPLQQPGIEVRSDEAAAGGKAATEPPTANRGSKQEADQAAPPAGSGEHAAAEGGKPSKAAAEAPAKNNQPQAASDASASDSQPSTAAAGAPAKQSEPDKAAADAHAKQNQPHQAAADVSANDSLAGSVAAEVPAEAAVPELEPAPKPGAGASAEAATNESTAADSASADAESTAKQVGGAAAASSDLLGERTHAEGSLLLEVDSAQTEQQAAEPAQEPAAEPAVGLVADLAKQSPGQDPVLPPAAEPAGESAAEPAAAPAGGA